MTTKKSKDHSEALSKLVAAAKAARLSAEQEAEATGLLKESLAATKAGVVSAVEAMTALPWIVGVNAVTETWPELKPAARKTLLAALAAQQTEQGRRFRLSLGRAISALDAEIAWLLIEGVCAEMLAAENGAPTQKDRQIFSNVLLGKGKPWLLHLPLAEIAAEKSGAVVRCAVASCFSGQCPPPVQLFVIRWIADAGRLAELPTASLESIAAAVKRWHPKSQAQLKTEVAQLPPIIADAIREKPAPQPRPEILPQKSAPENPARNRQPQPPAREKTRDAGFDLGATLRQIEEHVHSLRSELSRAKSDSSRQRETPRGRGRDHRQSRTESAPPDDLEADELRRHNRQLEETVAELRQRLEDLAADHEDIATSMGAHDETPLTDGKEQFKALLGIKLQTEFADFQKLSKEPPDEVLREHYRLLLEDVFNALQKQGIDFKEDATESGVSD
jgi:hypothetical protein